MVSVARPTPATIDALRTAANREVMAAAFYGALERAVAFCGGRGVARIGEAISGGRYPGGAGGRKMRTLLTLLGIVLLLAGLVFMGQGSGYFPYPASSFMISQSRWIYYGAGIAVVGLLILIVARR